MTPDSEWNPLLTYFPIVTYVWGVPSERPGRSAETEPQDVCGRLDPPALTRFTGLS
jgi:hypothetical protein